MTTHDTGPVRVPPEVMEGLEAVRRSGRTNMLDRPAVARIAAAMGYADTTLWIHANRGLYAQGIFRGFEAEGGGEARP